MGTVLRDTSGFYTSPGLLTFTIAGFYLITTHIQWAVFSATNQRLTTLFKNGGEWKRTTECGTAPVDVAQQMVEVGTFIVGDTLALYVYQDSTAAQNLLSVDMSITKLA
jgi:hypothetical protein